MVPSPDNLAAARRRMVEEQLRGRGIRDGRLLAAFYDVPREAFVPPERQHEAYEDHPLPIGEGQTVSQPYIVAMTLEALALKGPERVLDVGAGSGYQTALLARLAREVYAIERIEALSVRAGDILARLGVTNVRWRTGDGTLGWPEAAPFEAICCGAAGPDVPRAWLDQLAEGGRLVAPVGGREVQELVLLTRRGDRFDRRKLCDCRFVPLIGQHGWPE
ncbi:MAG: protein-L-isoaspartate(D-aspartate) O-methyltransferase [Planctomycetota bacterium]|nr:protein-L-isoaspartate(D-aspartate) O-methyltransferase [Planctomycetota bacterium]